MRTSNILDDLPTPCWLALVILSFIVFWPIGVMALVYLIWSGKMHCCMAKLASGRSGASRRWKRFRNETRSSGNTAFDEYRRKTLDQLEEERQAFGEFLHNLRRAKDQEEFDQFLSERAAANAPPSKEA